MKRNIFAFICLLIVLLVCVYVDKIGTSAVTSAQLDTPVVGVVKTATGVVKASPGFLYGYDIAFSAWGAGDKVAFLNGANDSSTALITTVPNAALRCAYSMVQPIYFATAIYCYRSQASGTAIISIQYK